MNKHIQPSDTAARHEAIDIGDFVYGATGTRIRRLTMPDGSHWFPVADVLGELGYTNPRKTLKDHVPEAFRTQLGTVTTRYGSSVPAGHGFKRSMNVVNLNGLIMLVSAASKPETRPFKKWITEVVITIQREGSYTLPGAEVQPSAPVAYAMPAQVADAIVRLEERNIRADEQFAAVQRETLETRREMVTAHQATAQALERIADRLDTLIADRPAAPPPRTTADTVLADWKSRMSVTEDVWAVAVTIAPALAADGELRQSLTSIATRTGLTEHRVNECLRFMRKHACIHPLGSTTDGVPVYGLSPARPL
ncbi:Bro-N domain-containing protein [Streptomyces sp. NBC_01506]|uniref:BRO-N domain-containing protein n=1 Tax=Streptomyces sp. NBC_01506 TaxID=2903887 RepID=UPI00386686E4